MISSVVNFRDFGGLSSRFGGTVKTGLLYRSGAIASLAEAESERLFGLDFAFIADLRYVGERDHEPSPWPLALAERVLSHDGGQENEAPHMAPMRDGTLTIEMSDQLYEDLYRALPFDPLYGPLFARTLRALPDADGPILVHCSAGKDRTGTLVALIHHALGVPREAIFADYMKSRTAPGLLDMAPVLAERLSQAHGHPIDVALMRHLLDVQESYLAALFDAIEARHGSVDAYLDDVGLDESDRERLRARLLDR